MLSAIKVKERYCLAIVEDDPFIREAWLDADVGIAVRTFACPREFWAALAEEPALLDDLVAVVTDHHFVNDQELGLEFAGRLRGRFTRPILLASDGEYTEGQLVVVDRRVAKTPVTLPMLGVSRPKG